ncbi:MAG: histidine--tRNA ligase [Myxococcota bacterium]|nr:histidine--tRNA ligase [Myxococcota bacterium]
MSPKSLKAPRGTRDFYPDEYRQREWLFDCFRRVAHRFAFEEVDAPMLEEADLFIRKAGEEIVDQLYHFEIHDHHLALRPEMTPSIARLVIARAGALRMPLRWFTITQNWRYERMQRGRKREHFQWNMDIWGEPGVAAEAELISALFSATDEMGLPRGTVRVRLNSRALLEESLRGGALRDRPEAFEPLCIVIDKLEKIGPESVLEQLTAPKGGIGLTEESAESVLALLGARDLDEAAAHVPDDSAALADLRRLFTLLDAYGVGDQVAFDASVVRGLAYYTGIVFEAFDAAGQLRSICGGGRYDRLSETLGGKAIPAVGFGFGDMVIAELLQDQNRMPELPRRVDDFVFALEEDQREEAIRLAARLRSGDRRVELALAGGRLKRALADANRIGANQIWMLGPDEAERRVVRVRDLLSGEEREEPLTE